VQAEKMRKHNIFLIDPKNIVLSGGLDTLDRHKIYADRVGKINSNLQVNEFKVICSYDEKYEKLIVKYKYLVPVKRVIIEKNFSFLFGAFKILKKGHSDSILLISGDPWQAAIYCLILKFFAKKNIQIQIQVHADIGDKSWKESSLKNRIKFLISIYTLRKADSVRCVTNAQLKKIEDKLRIENKKLFSSGIIYNIPSREMKKTNIFKNPTIGFIGRLEVDRGLWDFLKIVKKLNESGMKLDIKVVGVGKFQTEFIHKLKDINHGEVDYLGQLNSQDISLFWNAINLCIFTAPTESFGRGMRESLSNKIPVWAINSSGLEDLKSKFDADEIMQINASDTKELLVQKLRKSLSLKIDYDYANFFIKEQNMDLDNLINSWVQN
jgi:glycosyltransferase involved in cell wall biosynthesis